MQNLLCFRFTDIFSQARAQQTDSGPELYPHSPFFMSCGMSLPQQHTHFSGKPDILSPGLGLGKPEKYGWLLKKLARAVNILFFFFLCFFSSAVYFSRSNKTQTCKQEYASARKVSVKIYFVLINKPLHQMTSRSMLMPIFLLCSLPCSAHSCVYTCTAAQFPLDTGLGLQALIRTLELNIGPWSY